MVFKNKIFLVFLILSMGLLLSGCGLFNDIDLDVDKDLKEEEKANFLNTFVNDLEAVVQEFIDQTYYQEPEVTGQLEDPYYYLVFPDPEDLDLTQLLAHFDLFIIHDPYYYGGFSVQINGGPKLGDEKEFSEYIVNVLGYYLKDLLGKNEINQEDFNETDISVDFAFKYFYNIPIFGPRQADYPQEELQFVELIYTQKTTINGNETEKFYSSFLILAEYEDDFKFFELDFWNLLDVWPNYFYPII